ncbi:MAG: helix-turn-helix domain-containing protein [Candidatus Saccharibacteria bacterium]
MDLQTLEQFGLNKTQSKAYLALIKNGSLTPPKLAESITETRTNSYAVLDQLVGLGLAKKIEKNKKFTYHVENPIALEKLATKHRDEALRVEKQVKDAMPTLLNFFYTFSEQPGIRFFQGIDGIKEIYNDTLRTRQDIYLLRSPLDQDLMTLDFYDKYRKQRSRLGIKTHMLSPSNDSNTRNEETDSLHNIFRTRLPKNAYTGSVEMSIYGNKVALISFGEEAIGMIIESPQIANAMKQLFHLAQVGAKGAL